jgi:membrane dipeptidase
LIALDLPRLLHSDVGLGEIRGGMGVSEFFPRSLESRLAQAPKQAPVHLGVLIEGADCVRSPDELAWWAERGVVAIGLSWARDSRYAAGNATPAEEDRGLTDLGRALVPTMDDFGLVHDLSHLSDKATDELLELTARPVMASHSNSRGVFSGPGASDQRHLRDRTIREIARRGGVIGLNLYKKFLREPPEGGWSAEIPAGVHQASIENAVRHIEHVCEVVGHRRAVGLGSDMDGGFGAQDMCEEIERPAHLERLAEALRGRGWSDSDITGFAHENWCRFFGSALSVTRTDRRPG